MLTKAQIKHIQSLDNKKNRSILNEYVIEGVKLVQEAILSNVVIKNIYIINKGMNKIIIPQNKSNIAVEIIEDFEMEKISSLATYTEVLAIAEIKKPLELIFTNKVSLMLDSIQDPGNLGTIIRIADWYGIEQIICSLNTVDCYNSKVVQASMGSIFRVNIHYNLLENILIENNSINAFATTLHGININEVEKIKEGFIIIGSESHGISASVLDLCKHKITIKNKGKAESLNAGVAAGIICHTLLS
jgi:TrmH family RNA methyltransferase